jgi:sugar (pentulose or hexulose) kinase
VRAVVETQALSMRRFSEWIGHAPKQLVLTGGASRNVGIQRIVADVFQCPVRTLRVGNASALGGALRAAQAAGASTWKDLFSAFVALDPDVQVAPNAQARGAYEQLGRLFDEKLAERLNKSR